ncbi:MAG: HEAT repeat domain-containing protein [Polyangiales bacterium]
MRDVVLHRNLRAGRRDPDDLATLGRLAQLPAPQRVAFVSELVRLLADADPAWRRIALRCLAGMRGQAVEEAVIAALDDPDPDVRVEAVSTLRASPHPARLAYALLHARVDVRRAALVWPTPDTAPICFALRADPEVRDAVPPGMRPPTPMLPYLHVFATEGWIPRAEVRNFALTHAIGNEAKDYPPLREPAALWAWLFDMFEGAEPHQRILLGQRVWQLVRQSPVGGLAILRDERAKRPDRALTVLFAGFDAHYFVDDAEPLEERRAILREVALQHVLLPAVSSRKPLAMRLLAGPLARHTDGPRAGALDLAAVLSILALHPESPYGVLVDAFGFDEVAEAVLAEPGVVARLYENPASGKRDRAWFIDELARRRPEAAFDARAITLLAASVADPKLRDALAVEAKREGYASVVERLLIFVRGAPVKPKRANRLAERLAEHVAEADLLTLVRAATAEALGTLDDRFLGALGRRFGDAVADVLDGAPDGAHLAARIGEATTFPFAVERTLALRWKDHAEPARSAWATPRLPKPPPPAPTGTTTLDEATREAIVTAPDLGAVLGRLRTPPLGLTAVLARRLPEPSVSACTWLLVSGDPHAEVVSQLARFEGDGSPAFEELVRAAVARFAGRTGLSLLGHAALSRWEPHAYATLDALGDEHFATRLDANRRTRSVLARRLVWSAVARAVALCRWHRRGRLAPLATDALLDLLVDTFDSDLGVPAARLFMGLFEAGVGEDGFRARHAKVKGLLPKLAENTRAVLSSYAKLEGLPPKATSDRTFADVDARLAAIRKSTDLPFLEATLADPVRQFAEEAVQRLFELGEVGEERLLHCLRSSVPHAVHVARFAALFTHVDRERLRAPLAYVNPATRFHLALELDAPEVAVEAACARLDGASWMEPSDTEKLLARLGPRRFARELTVSPHPDAYAPAVRLCIDRGGADDAPTDDEARKALAAFLELGTERLADVRLDAARALDRLDDDLGMPLLIADVIARREPRPWFRVPYDALVEGALAVGTREAELAAATVVLQDVDLGREGRAALALKLLQARDAGVRASATDELYDPDRPSRRDKLRTLGELFAWGVRRGRELTGRLFRIRLISERRNLGHTQLGSNVIHVAGWPVFDNALRGRDVVEGLVLHELGHQVYHSDPASRELWGKAGAAGLQHLYNLVLDEHLERRLRARDRADGDRLKRLAAYAFQHSGRDLSPVVLLGALGPRSVLLLIGNVKPSFDIASVHVSSGELLRASSASGSSFARFVRALRMGMGDRDADPLVAEALSYFDRGFKDLDTKALYDLTLKLAALFGHEAQMLRCVGTPEELPGDDPNAVERREGISDDEVQREVERILAPPSSQGSGTPRGGSRLQINVGADQGFDPIRNVVRLPPDPVAQRALAQEVMRASRRLRADLEALGLARVSVGARLAGTRLDRPRACVVCVARRSPRDADAGVEPGRFLSRRRGGLLRLDGRSGAWSCALRGVARGERPRPAASTCVSSGSPTRSSTRRRGPFGGGAAARAAATTTRRRSRTWPSFARVT